MTASLRITDVLESGDEITAFVHDVAARGGLDERRAYQLRLAVDEITTNIAVHGYGGGPGEVGIEGGVDPASVWVRVTDRAVPFDPREHESDDVLATPAPEREAGGLGLFLALRGLDRFAYDYSDGHNRNTLVVLRTDLDTKGEDR